MANFIVLNWVAATGDVSYNVYRGTAAGQEALTPLNSTPLTVTTYTDNNVAPGIQYFYTVEALNAAGVSSIASNETSVTIAVVAPPTGLTAVVN